MSPPLPLETVWPPAPGRPRHPDTQTQHTDRHPKVRRDAAKQSLSCRPFPVSRLFLATLPPGATAVLAPTPLARPSRAVQPALSLCPLFSPAPAAPLSRSYSVDPTLTTISQGESVNPTHLKGDIKTCSRPTFFSCN